MAKADWRKHVAIGGLIFVIALIGALTWSAWTNYREYRIENDAKRNQADALDISRVGEDRQINCSMVGKQEFKCSVQSPDIEAADEHTKTDLKAQQDVAEWSFLNLWITGLGILLSALAVVFTGWAALQAARAANAAVASVDLSKKISADESRAYVHVSAANIYIGNDTPRIMVDIMNTGQTPALWTEISAHIFNTKTLNKGDIITEKVFPTEMISENFFRRSALGAQSQYSVPPTQAGFTEVFKHALINKNTTILNLVGIVRYETIHNEVFESQFWFVKYPPHEIKISRHPNAPKGVATYGTHTVDPQEMIMQICDLRTYQKSENREI